MVGTVLNDYEEEERQRQISFINKNKTMDPRTSFKIYPRIDKDFEKKRSLNFDMMKSEVYVERGFPSSTEGWRWLAFMLIGFFTGLSAFGMASLEEFLIDRRELLTEKALDISNNNQAIAWLVIATFCFCFCIIGSTMTVKYGPGANGSGIAECMAYLNGVNYPKFIQIDTLLTKIFCVVFGIAGGLCIGKEGPLAHVGACVAGVVIYFVPIPAFKYF